MAEAMAGLLLRVVAADGGLTHQIHHFGYPDASCFSRLMVFQGPAAHFLVLTAPHGE